MRAFYVILLATPFLASCSTVRQMVTPNASTPMPTETMAEYGTHYTVRGSLEIATEKAQAICDRWDAQAIIKNKQSAERGELPDSALEEHAANPEIPPWTPSRAKWETRILFVCR